MVNIWNMVRRQRINQYKTRRSTYNNDNKSFFFVGFCSLLQVSYIYICRSLRLFSFSLNFSYDVMVNVD